MTIEEIVCIKILMKVINFAANEIAKFDDVYKKKLEGLDTIIIWKVGTDLTFFTEIKEGRLTSGEGEKEGASLVIQIGTTSEALKILTGQVEFIDIPKKAKIAGDALKLQQNIFILETVKEYLGDLIGGGE